MCVTIRHSEGLKLNRKFKRCTETYHQPAPASETQFMKQDHQLNQFMSSCLVIFWLHSLMVLWMHYKWVVVVWHGWCGNNHWGGLRLLSSCTWNFFILYFCGGWCLEWILRRDWDKTTGLRLLRILIWNRWKLKRNCVIKPLYSKQLYKENINKTSIIITCSVSGSLTTWWFMSPLTCPTLILVQLH